MGSSTSSNRSRSYKRDFEKRLQDVKPDFYVQNVSVTDDDIFLAKSSWDLIMSAEETVPFKERVSKKSENGFNYTSTLTWFYDAFYNQFFEICPDAKPLFHKVSMVSQGRLIAAVITSALNSFKEPSKLKEKLSENTKRHNGKGIKSEWYSKMGEALIWALEHVIGDLFDEPTKQAWNRIYSFMLSIILPLSVEHEVVESRSASTKTTELKQSNAKSKSIWTNRRLDDFYVGALIRSHLPPSLYKVHVVSRSSSNKLLNMEEESEAHLPLENSDSVVTTMSGRCPPEFEPHLKTDSSPPLFKASDKCPFPMASSAPHVASAPMKEEEEGQTSEVESLVKGASIK